MKKKPLFVSIAIFMIAIGSLLLAKNYYLEYHISLELSTRGIQSKDIQCNGFYDINCKINGIELTRTKNSTLYSLMIEGIVVQNIIAFYSASNDSIYNRHDFAIDIKKLTIKDNKNVFDRIAKPIDMKVASFNKHYDVSLQSEKIKISVESIDLKKNTYRILTDIADDSMRIILYELYKLKYLEVKELDGEAFAKGINISFGIPSDSFIEKKEFFEDAMPRLIDLTISEIESYETFNQYSNDGDLSKILKDILTENGKKEYLVSLEF